MSFWASLPWSQQIVLQRIPSQTWKRVRPQFNSGTVIFDVNGSPSAAGFSNAIYRHNPTVAFSKVPSVAFGKIIANSGIQDFSYKGDDLDRFYVEVIKAQTNAVEFVFLHKPSVWNRIKLNMWISARDDLTLGSIKTGNDGFLFQILDRLPEETTMPW